jgi:hypothetical protein
MLTFEGYIGRLRLLRDKRRENNVTVTPGPMLLGSSDAGGTCPLHGTSAELSWGMTRRSEQSRSASTSTPA